MSHNSREVWVFVEQRGGKPADVSFELLSKGRKLADAMGGVLKSVVIGDDVRQIAAETFQFGADEALLVQHPSLRDYKTLPYSRILNELVNTRKPRIVLFGATITGRDLAPRVASHTVSGLTADCTDLKIADIDYLGRKYHNLLLQIRPAFGGNIIATIITPDNPIQMATVREGVMEKHPAERVREVRITEVPYIRDPVDDLVSIVEQHREESKINLKASPVIVAGG
jgi:electron transfer flavoprotein alpha subunit